MKPKLAILIPTVPGREKQLDELICKLKGGMAWREVKTDSVELKYHYLERIDSSIAIMTAMDDKTMTIGEKRNILYDRSWAEYSWQIDDDDSIAADAVSRIIGAIEERPDCITFQEHCTIDGGFFSSNHLLSYPDWEGNGDIILLDGFNYHRTPFFKDVIRTDIARSVPIPHIRFGEDHEWARALKPHLHSEVHIPEYLYFYQHVSSEHNARYGITE